MKNCDFTHLHLHTDYSFLDGVGTAEEYAHLASKHGQRAIACTDHGGLHGLPAMRRAATAHGLKFIPGCELYINDDRDNTKEKRREARADSKKIDPEFGDHHLVVLAIDNIGWHNLLKINDDSIRKGFYYKPRTTNDMVLEHNEGLIATTTCLGSEFSKLGRAGKLKELRVLMGRYKDAFGDRFFAELHVNKIDEQREWNTILIEEAKKLDIPFIIACDTHYACSHDKPRQDEMIGLARHQRLDDPKFWSLTTEELWFQTPRDILSAAREWDSGIPKDVFIKGFLNTVAIAERSNVEIYDDTTLKPPKYLDANGNNIDDAFGHLKTIAVKGLKKLMGGTLPQEYKDRMIRELRVIRDLGMSEFYLVTMDVVRECKKRGIFVWTRGSGCGSIIAAAIGITHIDPIRFGLLFERFVDPSRPNAPDFDLDIDASRRGEVVDWLLNKYGGPNGERIARIISLGTFRLKSAVQEGCWCHGHERKDLYRISDLVDKIDPSHEKAIAACNSDEREKLIGDAYDAIVNIAGDREAKFLTENETTIKNAMVLTGRVKNKGLHAAGYVIAPGPMVEYMPIDRGKDPVTGEPIIVTAWGEGQASQDIADTGLLKLDLLALDTISVVSECVKLVYKRHGKNLWEEIDTWNMDYSNPKVMKEFHTGNGFGLHQLNTDSQQLADFVGRLKPTDVRGLIAAIAMYRPGPMQFCDTFIARSHGREEAESIHPIFDEITAETYGIMVYQEQIMFVLNKLGGIELREAYMIIKAISKKKLKEIQKSKQQFVTHAIDNHNMSEEQATGIFEHIEKFAGYGFNKAHSASYGILSFVTAYLRSHYTIEFWYAWLNRTINKTSIKKKGVQGERKIGLMMGQAELAGQTLIGPVACMSLDTWQITKSDRLIAPLSILKGVGNTTATALRDAYKEHRFADIWEFLEWCEQNKKLANAGALKSMAKGNALKLFKVTVPESLAIVTAYCEAKPTKAKGLKWEQTKRQYDDDEIEWDEDQSVLLKYEKEVLGFNHWSNPWSLYGREQKVVQMMEARPGKIVIGEPNYHGVSRPFCITSIRKHIDKNGGEMAFINMLGIDHQSLDGICFASTWKGISKSVLVGKCYLVRGEFQGGKYMIGNGSRRGARSGGPIFRDIDEMGNDNEY